MKCWRVGIIGCGWAGQQHARALQALGRRIANHSSEKFICSDYSKKQNFYRIFFWHDFWNDFWHGSGALGGYNSIEND